MIAFFRAPGGFFKSLSGDPGEGCGEGPALPETPPVFLRIATERHASALDDGLKNCNKKRIDMRNALIVKYRLERSKESEHDHIITPVAPGRRRGEGISVGHAASGATLRAWPVISLALSEV
jgi:hypothetical protein